MLPSIDFVLGLIDQSDPLFVTQDDLDGLHGAMIRTWQGLGFIQNDPEFSPFPTCPHCRAGAIIAVQSSLFCDECLEAIERSHLFRWRVERRRFFEWLTDQLNLQGNVRAIDDSLWQLGSTKIGEHLHECFFVRSGKLPNCATQRLGAFRCVVLFHAVRQFDDAWNNSVAHVWLGDLLAIDLDNFMARPLSKVISSRSRVRFDSETGSLWNGGTIIGDVTPQSREFYILQTLAKNIDHFVPYEDLKRAVTRHTGSRDTTDDATFCQKLKVRVKKRIPTIDQYIATSNRGDGYRLRAVAEPLEK